MLMNKNDSILLIIDVQENLAPAQESPREVINGCASLLNVAKKLSIPFLIAEQDRSKFGPTMIDLQMFWAMTVPILKKIRFPATKMTISAALSKNQAKNS
ncbi:MAG: hypothetical protein V8R23_10410 [Alphaproteobacteria bacterium]